MLFYKIIFGFAVLSCTCRIIDATKNAMQTGLYYKDFLAGQFRGPENPAFFEVTPETKPSQLNLAGFCILSQTQKKKGAPKLVSAFSLACNLMTDAKI